jgi:hypothetical protein
MAQPKRIDELTLAASLSAGAAVAIVQDNATYRVPASAFITQAESFTQSGTGAVAGTVSDELTDLWVRPEHYSAAAIGGGAVDATAAINAAHTRALAIGGVLRGTPGATYLISGALDAWQVDFDFRGCTFSVENNPTNALTVGLTASSTLNITGYLPKIDNADHVAGWSGEGTGVRVLNCAGAIIFAPKVSNFAVGIHMDSNSSSGCAYNTIHIGRLTNNKKNIRLWASSSSGFVNQNTFIGGQYHIDSGEGSGIAGARMISLEPADVAEAAQNWPNNNTFVNPSIEGNGPEYHVELSGAYNGLITPRFEATTPKLLQTGHASSTKTLENFIFGGYEMHNVTHSSSGVVQMLCITGGRNPSQQVNGSAGERRSNITSDANSVLSVFSNGTPIEQLADTSTAWGFRLALQTLKGKRTTDTEERWRLDTLNGRLYLGPGGSTAIADYLSREQTNSWRFNSASSGSLGYPLGFSPAKVQWLDDFLGDVLADQWNGRVGTDPQCVTPTILADQQRGVVRLVTGDDAAADMATNGVQLESALNWRINQGLTVFEIRLSILSNVTSVALFVGLTDQNSALEMPFTLGAGDALTSNATDAVGFLYDTGADTDNWWAVGVASDVDATKQNLAVAPSASTRETLRVEVTSAGVATFYRNGAAVGSSMTGAVGVAVNLTPVVAAFSRSANSRNIDVDYILVEANR